MTATSRPARRGAWVVLLLALALRWSLAFTSVAERPVDSDYEHRYSPIARSLLLGHGFTLEGRPTARSGPVYPIVIAGVRAVAGGGDTPVRLAVVTLDGIQCALLFLLAWSLFGPLTAWLAGLGTVVCWPLVSLAWAATSNSVAIFFQSCFLFALVTALHGTGGWRWWTGAGVASGLTALTRAEALVVPLLVFPAVLLSARGERRRVIRGLAVAVSAFVLVLTPWTVRNHVRVGGFVPVQSIGGRNLLVGSPAARVEVEPSGSEVEGDRRAFRIAIDGMLREPGATLAAMSGRFRRLFWPERGARRWVNPLHLMLIVSAMIGAVLSRQRWRRWLPVAVVVPCYGALYTVFVVIYRYLLIVYPVLILFAALAGSLLLGRLIPGLPGTREAPPRSEEVA